MSSARAPDREIGAATYTRLTLLGRFPLFLLPTVVGVPPARWSLPDLRREVLARGLVATVSGTTLWRWLDADAIRPGRHRSWLFPRDPRCAECADAILDLYEPAGTGAHWGRATTFTRADLHQLLAKLAKAAEPVRPAA